MLALSAAFSARIVPALKSASGFEPSAAENCLIRSSRERAIVSATSSRTRFCTEATTPSEKRFSRSLASWPFSGAEDLVDALAQMLGDRACLFGELAVQLRGGALELGLDELGVGAGLLAVEHARADLDGVADELDRVLAVLLALLDEPDGAFVVDDQAVDGHAITDARGRGAA